MQGLVEANKTAAGRAPLRTITAIERDEAAPRSAVAPRHAQALYNLKAGQHVPVTRGRGICLMKVRYPNSDGQMDDHAGTVYGPVQGIPLPDDVST